MTEEELEREVADVVNFMTAPIDERFYIDTSPRRSDLLVARAVLSRLKERGVLVNVE